MKKCSGSTVEFNEGFITVVHVVVSDTVFDVFVVLEDGRVSIKIAILILFLLVIISLGLYSRKMTKTVDDFVVGNRSIGPWMSAFSFGTAYFSAVLIIGFAGKVGWGYGLAALWIALGNAFLGTFLAWKILAPRTRELTSRMNVVTMPSFLEARYDSTNMKIFSSIVIFIFFVPYSASVFIGLSYLFEQVFSVPYIYALLIMTLMAGFYLVLGGYMAVALVDFVQGLVMIAGVLMMIYFVQGNELVGGFARAYNSLKAMDPAFIMPGSAAAWVGLISLIILTSFGTWGLPQMIQKFYGIKNAAAIPRATIVSTAFAILVTGGAYFVGSLSHLFFDRLPLLDGKPSPDLIMPNIIASSLPELVAILIMILVLSASMSTLSSLVLVSSSSVTIDLLKGALFPELSEKATIFLMRLLCLVFIALSFFIALKPPAVILTLMALSWGTVAGTFLAPYLFGLFWPKTTRSGAWAGMLTGLLISLGGYLIISFSPSFIKPEIMTLFGRWGMPFFSSLAMLVPLIVIPVVSRITAEYSLEHVHNVFDMEEAC